MVNISMNYQPTGNQAAPNTELQEKFVAAFEQQVVPRVLQELKIKFYRSDINPKKLNPETNEMVAIERPAAAREVYSFSWVVCPASVLTQQMHTPIIAQLGKVKDIIEQVSWNLRFEKDIPYWAECGIKPRRFDASEPEYFVATLKVYSVPAHEQPKKTKKPA